MFSRHNGGWTVVFSIPDPTLGISWRMGDSGEFRETGFLDTLDPRTRKRMPNPSIELAADAPAATIEVRYVDTSGELQGPFPIKFDPEAALIHDQRKILDMTATSWLSFREFNGLLVYYTHLMSYRCAIREVRIGVDTAVPDRVLQMPPCDIKDPSAIPYEAKPYLKLSPSAQLVSVELTYRDGSVSEIKSFRRYAINESRIMDAGTASERPNRRTITTRCCIVGGGPAGMMLGYLLGRAGVDTLVLEKHADFFRDFRGDTVHPSTLQVMDELGLIDGFLNCRISSCRKWTAISAATLSASRTSAVSR